MFSGKGQVTVAAAKAKEFKGDLPEVDAIVFRALTEAKVPDPRRARHGENSAASD